jgi:hypothetical protein
MLKFKILILISISALLFTSCEKETETTAQKDLLLGTWNLSTAFRDGKETETLDNFKLEFENDTLLYSNLTGTREEQKYTVSKNTIKTQGARLNPEYEIVNITDSTLTLKMLYNEVSFDFELVR